MADLREHDFDGLVGPTHQYAGLSRGNLASTAHAGEASNPRAAALQGLEKMRVLARLGAAQGVLPPQPRPDVDALRRLGFSGGDSSVLEKASRQDPRLLRLVSSASSMWAANAATVVPSCDADDGKTHFAVANLASMFHRSLEASTTGAALRALFADEELFAVHPPLPGGVHFGDEGAANHTRLASTSGVVHLFAWGRTSAEDSSPTQRFPARQAREASEAVARLCALPGERVLFARQDPAGIDAGAFHTDVLAVGSGSFVMLHERAFVEREKVLGGLARRLGDAFRFCLASGAELPVADAVAAYPFNSQLVELPSGEMTVVAPRESEATPSARRFLERVVAEENPVTELVFIDVNASMNNGGGPACLRLRVPLTDAERRAVRGRVFFDDALFADLSTWVARHYRDRLAPADLADPRLLDEVRTALDDLTVLLQLGSIYDFQRA